MLDLIDELLQLSFFFDNQLAVIDRQLCPRIEHAGKDDFPRPRRDVDKTSGPGGHMWTEGKLRDVDGTVFAYFEK
ncbi:hypothetical protein D3C72_1165660 [compost metagenome]